MMRNLFSILLLLLCCSTNAEAQNIIPKPNTYKSYGDQYKFYLSRETSIGYANPSLKDAANYLAEILRPSTGFPVKVLSNKVGEITLEIEKSMPCGGYTLDILSEGVVISAADYRGIIAGIQSFRQLLPAEIESRQKVDGVEWEVPCCLIEDAPRFNYRGLELDVSRHFYTVKEIKELLDVMALYKLNKFHWHLTDDQGWRIEIKRYPKLTQNGAWRKYNIQDVECNRQADAMQNEDMRVPTDRQKIVNGETLYGGFYTQKEIKEIVEYARVRGIDIIPEVDMPGHILAAEENYKGIACFDQTGWGDVFSSPACPGKDSAMEFCKNVYAEIVNLFPYEYVHIGGDEVEKKNWKKCPDCQKRMKENGLKTEEELQSWFIHEMEKFLNSKGKKMIGWNEIIEGGLSETSTIMWWGSWVKDAPEVTTAHGNDLINTRNDIFYLDYNEGSDAMKNIYNYDATCNLPKNQQEHLLGVQGNIWCEYIPTMNRMWYQTANRMLAIAELGWSDVEPKNYYEFEDRMISQLPRFATLGVRSKILPIEGFSKVNAFVGEGRYHVTCKDPSVVIRYTTDGSIPSTNSTLLDGDLVVYDNADINFAAFRKDGSRGDVISAKFNKEEYSPAVKANIRRNGLVAEWHEFPGIDCDKITEAPINSIYEVSDVSIPEGVKGNIGLITEGFIYVPENAVYTFTLTSDDGSDLFIDGKNVVDMNKEQSPTTLVGQKALARGYHSIRVRYFDHNGGCLGMVVTNSRGEVMNPSELYYSE